MKKIKKIFREGKYPLPLTPSGRGKLRGAAPSFGVGFGLAGRGVGEVNLVLVYKAKALSSTETYPPLAGVGGGDKSRLPAAILTSMRSSNILLIHNCLYFILYGLLHAIDMVQHFFIGKPDDFKPSLFKVLLPSNVIFYHFFKVMDTAIYWIASRLNNKHQLLTHKVDNVVEDRSLPTEGKPLHAPCPQHVLPLSEAFNTSANLWVGLQKDYDLWHSEKIIDRSTIRRLYQASA